MNCGSSSGGGSFSERDRRAMQQASSIFGSVDLENLEEAESALEEEGGLTGHLPASSSARVGRRAARSSEPGYDSWALGAAAPSVASASPLPPELAAMQVFRQTSEHASGFGARVAAGQCSGR